MRLNNSKELANFLKLQRKRQERTQTDVATHIGLKQKTISSIENSAGTSRIDTLFKVAHELGLSIELLPKQEENSSDQKKPNWDQEW